MYIAITGSKNNKDVYIYQSFCKENGKGSSHIYKKLGKYNTLLEQFHADEDQLITWAKEQAAKETELYKEHTGKIAVEFSKAATIPMNERRSFHTRQIERTKKILSTPGRKRKGKNQNDPMRFIKKTAITPDGEIAEKQLYDPDEEQIEKEETYDGFYAVITKLEGDVSEIIRINKQRWEIKENFRIMKTEFEARPVYVRREDRIKAHFMTCYISLLLYRLLEKSWTILIQPVRFSRHYVLCR